MRETIIKGIRNPEKVPPYLRRKIRDNSCLEDGYQTLYAEYHRRIRSRNACLYRYKGFSDIPTEGRDGIQKTFFGNLELSQHQYHNFLTYLKLCDFAHYSGSSSILEIGAGYSTAIWAGYAERTGAEVTSVDGSFDLLEDWIKGTRHEDKVDGYVNLVKGASVESKEVRQFYAEPQAELGGIEVSRFASDLDRFARSEDVSVSRLKKMDSLSDRRNWSAEDLVVSDGKLSFSEEFLDSYTIWTSDYEDYISMLNGVERTGVVDQLYEETGGWDLIWFDSGEISSIVEWQKFKNYVNPGGLAAFHDVFFPRSMKNFVVGACLLNDPDWEVLLVDDTTKQGLLVARKNSF